MIDLRGKTILVCGIHHGGIGGATCRQVAQAGGDLVVLDREQPYIDEISDQVRSLGGNIRGMTVDLMDADVCESIVPTVLERFGPIDGVANIAGGTRPGEWLPLDETPGDSFWATVQLNFGYMFYVCRDLAREWIRSGQSGTIVNVGSVSAKDSAPWHGPYGASKAAIITLTRTMANEWHEFGIRANSVSPGAVRSERVLEKANAISGAARSEVHLRDDVGGARVSSDTPAPPIVTQPVEVANAITFLLSDLASGVSGQDLAVDRSLSTNFCAGARKPRTSGP
jgi:3-oxoacyl-[acyl-carrier protein] reductase